MPLAARQQVNVLISFDNMAVKSKAVTT